MGRLIFGKVVPCPRCQLAGRTRAPAMGKDEREQRRRENLQRAARRLEPLPRPPAWVDCEMCGGRGVLEADPPDNADPTVWEI